MTPSAYVRACVFAEDARLRKTRPKDTIDDKNAAAEALALLGQSRIASDLNQLDDHANMGALIVGESEKTQIVEAKEAVQPSEKRSSFRPISQALQEASDSLKRSALVTGMRASA